MFAPGHKGGDDVWINGVPKSQWYAQNPSDQPTGFYDESHPYLPEGFIPPSRPTQAPQTAATPPMPSAAAPSVLSGLAQQLSPATTNAMKTAYGAGTLPNRPRSPFPLWRPQLYGRSF